MTPVYGAEIKVGERIRNTVSKFGKLGNVASSLVVHGNMYSDLCWSCRSERQWGSLIPRLFPPPVFDRLQYAKTEGEGLGESHS